MSLENADENENKVLSAIKAIIPGIKYFFIVSEFGQFNQLFELFKNKTRNFAPGIEHL